MAPVVAAQGKLHAAVGGYGVSSLDRHAPAVGRDPERPAVQVEPAELGDRRIVTALFADLVDYVRMLAENVDIQVIERGGAFEVLNLYPGDSSSREQYVPVL